MRIQNNDLNSEIEKDLSLYNIDHRRDRDNGVAEQLLQNNDLWRQMSQDNWSFRDWVSPVTEMVHGRKDGKFYQTEIQHNCAQVAAWCQRYRKMSEEGVPDTLAPPAANGKLGFRWINLPKVFARRIQNDYFGGMPWEVIKEDKMLKAQFYMVVEREYNQYVCHPGGKLPLPFRPRYPSKSGGDKTQFTSNWTKGK